MNEAKKSIREYSYSDDRGDAQAVVYHLFPGVEVAYLSVHMADFDFGLFEQKLYNTVNRGVSFWSVPVFFWTASVSKRERIVF